MLAKVDEVTSRTGQGHPVEQGPADPGGRAGDGRANCSSARASGSSAGSCWRGSTIRRAHPNSVRSRPRPQSLQARSARLRAEGTRRIGDCAGGGERSGAAARSAVRHCRSRVAALSASAEQRRREAARRKRRSTACRGSLALAQTQRRHARAAGGEEYRPADRTAQRAPRSGRSAGPDRRGAGAVGPGASRGRRGAEPGQRGRASRSARMRSTNAARSTQKIAVNEQSLRGARGRLGPAWNCAHRSMASSTTSR